MDIEERELLEETAELAKENNKVIKKLYRAHVISRTLRVIYWILIIGIAFGLFYFLQPYIDFVKSLYGGTQEKIQDARGILDNFGDVLGEDKGVPE